MHVSDTMFRKGVNLQVTSSPDQWTYSCTLRSSLLVKMRSKKHCRNATELWCFPAKVQRHEDGRKQETTESQIQTHNVCFTDSVATPHRSTRSIPRKVSIRLIERHSFMGTVRVLATLALSQYWGRYTLKLLGVLYACQSNGTRIGGKIVSRFCTI